MRISASDQPLRRIVAIVAVLNLGYFGIEFAVALAIGSVSLFADSIDFLEDTSINLLILLALGFRARTRARVGMLLAGIILEAIGFPTSMFTVLFAVARTVGWVAQWKEMIEDPTQRIGRPRQLYTGYGERPYLPIEKRK